MSNTEERLEIRTNAVATPRLADSATRLTRATLSALPLQSLHEARNWSKADVSLIEWPPASGRRVVVKDLRRCPLWFRRFAGRRFLRREWEILRRLRDLSFAPDALYQIDADAIAIEYRAGISARHADASLISAPVLGRVEASVRQLHERGIMHGDLHGDNILIGEDGQITFIDWATSVYFGSPPRGLKARLFAEGRDLDRRAVAKLKLLYAPESVTDEENALVQGGGSRLYRGIKSIRRWRDKRRARARAQAAHSS